MTMVKEVAIFIMLVYSLARSGANSSLSQSSSAGNVVRFRTTADSVSSKQGSGLPLDMGRHAAKMVVGAAIVTVEEGK